MEELDGLQSMGSGRVGHDWVTSLSLSVVKNLLANARDLRDLGSIPGSGRPPGGEHGNPLQYSHLENLKDSGDCGLWSIGSQRVRHD